MSTRDADPASNDVDAAETNGPWGEPSTAPEQSNPGLSVDATRHTRPAEPSRRPPTHVNSCGAPSRHQAAASGSTNSLKRVCSRDQPEQRSGHRAWLPQRFHVTPGAPPEVTPRDHRPAHHGTPTQIQGVLRGTKGNRTPDLFHLMHTTDRPPRPAASCGGHPRPMLSDRRSAQKPRRRDVFRPSGGGESVDVAPRPVASAAIGVGYVCWLRRRNPARSPGSSG
jgi:hypothetical protein